MKKVYLDSAATTQVRPEVISKMQDALANCYGNPSSSHGFGRTAKTAIEKTRKTIAKYLNAHPAEIIFTSGGTEADNMILRCSVRDLGVKTLITSKIEHHAVLHTAEALAQEYGIELLFVDLDGSGNPDLAHLESLLKRDIEAVGKLCLENDALFHSDTVQSIGHFPWDVQKSKAHFLTAAAHKFHGPKGVGFAYIKRNVGLKPLIFGGSQERGFRAGTEPFHNIVGLEEAFKAAYDHLDEEMNYVMELKRYFIEKISKAIPDVAFNGLSGDMEGGTYTLVNVRLPFDSQKALMLLFHLDLKGIACSKGSACQSGSDIGSHVLEEILSPEDMEKPSLRFSFSKYNTKEELDYVVEVLQEFGSN